MTLTDTVTSFAHDAVSTATDLGSQAVEIGRNAADVGLDVATNVATAAGQLAQSLLHKVPVVVPKRRSRAPWILGAIVAVIAVGAAFARRKSRRDDSQAADQRSLKDDAPTNDEVAAPRHVARVS